MVLAVNLLYLLVLGWVYSSPAPKEQLEPGTWFDVKPDPPVEASVRKKLTEQLKPIHLEVVNEGDKHGTPHGADAHFWVKIVSPLFSKMSLLKRHQMVNEILKEELETKIHALTIIARSPEQWDEERGITPPPACQGDGIPDDEALEK